MITSSPVLALQNSDTCGICEDNRGAKSCQPACHPVPPSDPIRQAKRLPIKILNMLTARTGHILHPEYLQPLPSTPISPIELDAKKSPLALLAQTCSQIGKPDPSPTSSSKLTPVSGPSDKDSKSGSLKLSDIGAEDKSSFKPYAKPAEKKEASPPPPQPPPPPPSTGDKSGFRVTPSAPCRPFTPASPQPAEREDSGEAAKGAHAEGGSADGNGKTAQDMPKAVTSDPVTSLIAPVSPYKPGQPVFPLPPYPGTYGGYPQHFLPLGCGTKAGSSPLAGASPPSLVSASICRDPYCLSYTCSPESKPGYPLVYPPHPLHQLHTSPQPLYPYGFLLPNDPLPHVCNWVSANGPCDKRFPSPEELLSHLRTHTAFTGADKLISGYPSSSSLAAAAMACHVHGAPPGALRSPHHPALGLGSRYHPYSNKSPLSAPGAPVPVPTASGSYYSPYTLYGQRLTAGSALGYQ